MGGGGAWESRKMAAASPVAFSFFLVDLVINLKECAPARLAAPWKQFSVFVS